MDRSLAKSFTPEGYTAWRNALYRANVLEAELAAAAKAQTRVEVERRAGRYNPAAREYTDGFTAGLFSKLHARENAERFWELGYDYPAALSALGQGEDHVRKRFQAEHPVKAAGARTAGELANDVTVGLLTKGADKRVAPIVSATIGGVRGYNSAAPGEEVREAGRGATANGLLDGLFDGVKGLLKLAPQSPRVRPAPQPRPASSAPKAKPATSVTEPQPAVRSGAAAVTSPPAPRPPAAKPVLRSTIGPPPLTGVTPPTSRERRPIQPAKSEVKSDGITGLVVEALSKTGAAEILRQFGIDPWATRKDR